jgi:hypothetical protein
MNKLLVALGIAGITLLTFFCFPGHTWVYQDSQIYAAILEHLRDPSVLGNDLLVQHSHVSFTLYDEIALGLRTVTGLGFEQVLGGVQIAARGLGVWGVYLMATAAGLAAGPALLVAGILSLGAVVAGPTVLTIEYEPIPRGIAIPLLLLAAGLVARGRYAWAGVAGAAAFLIHPPTVYPFWGVYFVLALWPSRPETMRARLYALIPLFSGALILLFASRHQAGAREVQVFLGRLGPDQEQLERLRTSYVWVSTWAEAWLPHYLTLWAAGLVGLWRVRHKTPFELRVLLVGMPLAGMLSVPLSWLLLERMKWALIPQIQPARALVFVVVAALFTAAVAAVRAAERGRWLEALLWFALAYVVPASAKVPVWPGWRRAAAVALMAALATLAAGVARRRWAPLAMAVAVAAGFFVIPRIGRVQNYPRLNTPELAQLAGWARSATARDAVFLFPDAGYGVAPGIFRAGALRAVYVDWKGGGQVNYLRELGEEWWRRWQATGMGRFRAGAAPRYAALGIDYMVLEHGNRPPGMAAVFENRRYAVYKLR